MKKDLIIFRVGLDYFHYGVTFVFGEFVDTKKFLEKKFGKPLSGGYENNNGLVFFEDGYFPVVWLPKLPETNWEISVLAHECCHAIHHLFQYVAIDLKQESGEVFAHGVGFLIKEVLNFKDKHYAKNIERSKCKLPGKGGSNKKSKKAHKRG